MIGRKARHWSKSWLRSHADLTAVLLEKRRSIAALGNANA
jgi:hypothetical protein